MKLEVVDVTLSVREMEVADTCPGCAANLHRPNAIDHRPWDSGAGGTDIHACAACGHILALGTIVAPPQLRAALELGAVTDSGTDTDS